MFLMGVNGTLNEVDFKTNAQKNINFQLIHYTAHFAATWKKNQNDFELEALPDMICKYRDRQKRAAQEISNTQYLSQ